MHIRVADIGLNETIFADRCVVTIAEESRPSQDGPVQETPRQEHKLIAERTQWSALDVYAAASRTCSGY
ncbi:hypothetical protein GWI33_001437 [Rhynchophorus ferrugineus]|uniref:Uncharacterized protein n=1 Tax=Rhynchophorus ferrugineus TaxID=354439 RepID=A0A834MLD9_RHYFE|nr:hypothetical protein GWI33_001437 [Rhynchophorus ferrugineus]